MPRVPTLPLLALAWVLAGGRLLDRDAPRNALMLLAPLVAASRKPRETTAPQPTPAPTVS